MSAIYDPAHPNDHGYTLYRADPTLAQFLSGWLWARWFNLCWSLYGRDRVVAWCLHREQTLLGRIENQLALQILAYLYP